MNRFFEQVQKYHWLALIAFSICVSMFYYGPFLHNFFVMDDYRYLENVIEGPVAVILGYNAQLRVVSNSVWYPLYLLSGGDPFGYNLCNLCVNLANSLLLYYLLLKLTGKKALSFFTAAIFISSSVAADAVFWRMSISALLATFFYLLTLCLYVEYRQNGRKILFYSSIAVYILAIFSKEDAASLPFTVLIMELLFFGAIKEKKSLINRTLPYVAVIVLYLVVSNVLFRYLGIQSETGKFFKIRPFYSLLGGGTAFFVNPSGFLESSDPAIYLTAMFIPLSFALVSEKKYLLLGYLWILVAFLPESLTAITQFQPRTFASSISRLLYLPSIGSALVLGTILASLKEKFPPKVYRVFLPVFFLTFLSINYGRVHERGEDWLQEGAAGGRFIIALKNLVPKFPENSYVSVSNGPTSNDFMMRSLRVFYGNPKIYYLVQPYNVKLKEGDSQFLIFCDSQTKIPLEVLRVK